MKLYRKAIADLIWEAVFAIAALRWRKHLPPTAKPYNPVDATVTSITNLKTKRGN
jgi:hypothetical protein